MTKIRYYTEQRLTPTFIDVLKAAKGYAFGEQSLEFEEVSEPGPGVLCFGAGLVGHLMPTQRVITMSADGLSLLTRGLRIAGGLVPPPAPHAVRVIEDVSELDALGDNIVVDIETRGDIDGPRGDLELLCIGIWDGSAMPIMLIPSHLCGHISDHLKSRKIICHNSAFDVAVLNAVLGTRLRPHADTLVLHYSMHPASKSHGLKDLARYYLGVDDWDHDLEQYTGRGKSKDYGKIPLDILYRYCALDVYYTGLLLVVLTQEATDSSKRFYEQRMKDNNLLIEIEEGPGVYIDIPYFERLHDNMQAELDAARSIMVGIVGDEKFNPASPVQVKKYLHAAGFDIATTEAKELEKFAGEPFVDALLGYKKTLKMRGFVKSFLEKNVDGYLHPQFKIARTATGRLASSNVNIQQIPREGPVKKGIIAPPGYKIVTADYSQVELRVMAVLSGDKEMQARFQPDSGDFFDALMPAAFPDLFPSLEAYEVYKAEHGGKDKVYRTIIKQIVYGISYSRGAGAIAESIGQSKDYAQKIIDNIFAAYPQWGQWREGIKRDAVAGTLTAWTGMPFEAEIIHWRNRAELERSGLSFMPQHHANQLTLNGARKMHETLNGRGWIHAVVHDAAYLYVKEEYAQEVACELEAALVQSGQEFFGDAVVFAAGPEIGDTWEEV